MTWWAVGTAVVGAAGSYLSSKNAAKAGKATPTETALQNLQLQQAQQTGPMALDYLKTGAQQLGTAGDFWNNIYRGGRAGALGMLGPQLQMADQQQQAAYGSAQRLQPRGGGSADARLGAMDNSFANRNNALLSLRPQAAQMLQGVGSQFANMGTSLFSGTSSSNLGLLGALQNQQQMGFDQQRAAGQGAYQIANSLQTGLTNYLNNRPKTTPGTGNTSGGYGGSSAVNDPYAFWSGGD